MTPTLPSCSAAGGSLPGGNAVWTGHLALFWSGGAEGLACDAGADAWWSFDAGGLRSRGDPVLAWTGHALVGWAGYNEGGGPYRLENDGIRYRPPPG